MAFVWIPIYSSNTNKQFGPLFCPIQSEASRIRIFGTALINIFFAYFFHYVIASAFLFLCKTPSVMAFGRPNFKHAFSNI